MAFIKCSGGGKKDIYYRLYSTNTTGDNAAMGIELYSDGTATDSATRRYNAGSLMFLGAFTLSYSTTNRKWKGTLRANCYVNNILQNTNYEFTWSYTATVDYTIKPEAY